MLTLYEPGRDPKTCECVFYFCETLLCVKIFFGKMQRDVHCQRALMIYIISKEKISWHILDKVFEHLKFSKAFNISMIPLL